MVSLETKSKHLPGVQYSKLFGNSIANFQGPKVDLPRTKVFVVASSEAQ